MQAVVLLMQVSNAWGHLPLPRFWLLLLTTARSGNLSGVKTELVGPQNKYNNCWQEQGTNSAM